METEFHTELSTRVAEWVQLKRIKPAINFRLPHGKFADLIYLSREQEIVIIEVKTVLNSSLVEEAKTKYAPYCNRLWIAAPQLDIQAIMQDPQVTDWPRSAAKIGLLEVTTRSVTVKQEASFHQITMNATDYLRHFIKERVRFADPAWTISEARE